MIYTFIAPNTQLSGFSLKYKFQVGIKNFKLIIDTDAEHGFIGRVKITLANIQKLDAILGFSNKKTVDFLNDTFTFYSIGARRLEADLSVQELRFVNYNETALQNNGTPYTATIQSNEVELLPNKEYAFTLASNSNFGDLGEGTTYFEVQEQLEGGLVSKVVNLYENTDYTTEPQKISIDGYRPKFNNKAKLKIINPTSTTKIYLQIQ